jgi:RNA polymerase sigma-70 factor (ECF subfamily)
MIFTRSTEQQYPQGETFDFDRFLREQRPGLERYIGSRIGVTMDVDDIAAEAMLQTFMYCRAHPDRLQFCRAVLFKITRNRIADYFARRAKAPIIPIEEASPIPAPNFIPTTIDAEDELRSVRSVLATIREEYREVITLKAIVGLSTSEIAELMEKPPAHVRVLLFRARRALRRTLRRQYPERYGENEMDQS